MKCGDCGAENAPASNYCIRCGKPLVACVGSSKAPIKRPVKAAIIALVAVAVACILVGVAANACIHRPSILLNDPDEPDVPDDYDVIMLEGELSGDVYVVMLSVAGEVQSGYYYGIIPLCCYQVGVWVKEIGRPSPYVFSLLYIEDEEQHHDLRAIRDGNVLMIEFPLSFLSDNAYIVGLSARTWWVDNYSSTTSDIVGDNPGDDCAISHLLDLPFSPFVLFVAAGFCILAAVVAAVASPYLRL